MCGLFGIAGQGIVRNDISVFDDLMIFSIVRGDDGTGVAYGNSNRKLEVTKMPADACTFRSFLTNHEKNSIESVSNNLVIGHTRKATMGGISHKATQPFDLENIVGVHNGTLWSDFDGFNSDSEMLLTAISEFGLPYTMKNMVERDALALVWFDKKDRRLHFYRNEERELFFAVNSSRNVIYWASELSILRAAISRHGIEAHYWSFSIHTEFSFDPGRVAKNGKAIFQTKVVTPVYAPLPTPTNVVPFKGIEVH